MFKLLGCVLIVAASSAAGLIYAGTLNKRIQGILAMIELFSALKIKINYQFTPIPQLLKELSFQSKKETADFLKNCTTLIENGKDLKQAWNVSAEKYSEKMFLNKSDMAVLKDFSASLGDSDVGGQITNISLYLEMLKVNLKEAEAVSKDKTKVVMSLSIFGGLVFSILLV